MTHASIRHALSSDAEALTAIEAAADARFEPLFGALDWEPEDGAARLAARGFVVVAEADGAAVGFAHVLEVGDVAHLEQLSVRPEHAGNGVGGALLDAAMLHAAALGCRRMTLRTFVDIPWNGPWYRCRGFEAASDDVSRFHAALPAAEHRLGLHALGPRELLARRI